MEQARSMNLPLAGRIQHGEKQINGQKQKVIDYGYFIAKVKEERLSFLKNKFDKKYHQSQIIHIKFFTETPLLIRYARYNQSGLVCYCGYNQNEGKQRIDGKWTPIKCSEECQYRVAKENKRPSCSCEGNLKFLLPDISMDRIWTMKITGYTSIFRLKEYIEFQKYLGNSIIGDYYLFLKKEIQTNREGKSFENFILDIVRKEDFDSNNFNETQKQLFSSALNYAYDSVPESKALESSPIKIASNKVENICNTLNDTNIYKKQTNTDVVSTVQTEKKVDKPNTSSSISNSDENNPFKNYYVLVESYEKELTKDGKLTKYQFATFEDQYNNIVDAMIAPQFIKELSECDVGTIVQLDLKTVGNNIITNNIKFIQKCKKNIVA